MSNQKNMHRKDDKRIEELRTRIAYLIEKAERMDIELKRKERELLRC